MWSINTVPDSRKDGGARHTPKKEATSPRDSGTLSWFGGLSPEHPDTNI
jgi:hypothetical protein